MIRGATPIVVAAAGRRIDAVNAVSRFPLHNRHRVQQAITAVLSAQPVVAFVSSAACGADLLGLEAARALGVRRRIILPSDVVTFRRDSVVDRPGEWGALYDALIHESAARGDLIVLDVSHEHANQAILAEGHNLAAPDGADKLALVIWEGVGRGDDDHTADFQRKAKETGWRVAEILTA